MSDQLLDQGPAGGSFTHNGITYVIEPKIMGGRAMRHVRRTIADMNRTDLAKLLNQTSLSEGAVDRICARYKQESQIGFKDIMQAVQLPEVVASLLSVSCDEIKSYTDALAIVDDYPNFMELMAIVLQATGLNTLKNSKAPANANEAPGGSESELASEETLTETTPVPTS